MKATFDIDDYLSADEKKELCKDYIREMLRGDGRANHIERVLSNMAYEASFAILDSVLTPEMMATIRTKVEEQINKVSDFGIFRRADAWGAEDSAAYLEVKKAVAEHKHLINPLVREAIVSRDYSKDLPSAGDYLGEVLVDAIQRGLAK